MKITGWRKPLPMFFLLSSVAILLLALLTMIHSFTLWYVTRSIFFLAAIFFFVLAIVKISVAVVAVYKRLREKTVKLSARLLEMILPTIAAIPPTVAALLLAISSVTMFTITTVKIGQYGMMPQSDRVTTRSPKYGLVDYRGQIHVHSYLSDDASSDGTFEKIAQAARRAGVSWVILTDHIDDLPPGNYPDIVNYVLFVYGNECNWKEGSSRFLASLKNSQPMLHLFGHAEKFGSTDNPEWESWDAIELVNFHANFLENPGEILNYAFFDPKHTYQVLTSILPRNLKYWQSLAEREKRPIPIFSGPDAHQNMGILGVPVDPYDLMLSLVSTHIWLGEKEPLNQDSIFSAIKKGRTYIAFDYLGEPNGFQFWAESESGEKFFTGEIVKKPKRLAIDNPLPTGSRVKFILNNQLVYLQSSIENPQPGFWRVEIWRDGYPWIVSGQILVKQ